MLYLLDKLTDKQGASGQMLGLLKGEATLQPRMTAMALQQAALPEGLLRGHSFHYSALTSELQPLTRGECPNYKRTAEAVYRQGRLTASYIHFYLASDPAAAAALFLPSRPLKSVGEAGKTRQKQARKRSLRAVNEHSEPVFNAVLPTQVVIQRPASERP